MYASTLVLQDRFISIDGMHAIEEDKEKLKAQLHYDFIIIRYMNLLLLFFHTMILV